MRRLILAYGLAAGLSACGRTAPDTAAQAPAVKTARVMATVIGVDRPNGTITLQHGPIPAWGWPATRMAFSAPPEAIASAHVGDRVSAELKQGGGPAEITALLKP